jgi:hypothetical protein
MVDCTGVAAALRCGDCAAAGAMAIIDDNINAPNGAEISLSGTRISDLLLFASVIWPNGGYMSHFF